MMTSIQKRLSKMYIDMPLFYKIYIVTSGITYMYFPETKQIIATNTKILIGAELLDQIDKYIRDKHPDQLVLCDTLNTANIVCKIGALGYISNQMKLLGALHNSFVGFGYSVNGFLLKLAINISYYSAVSGSVMSFGSWCCVKIFKNTRETFIRQLPALIESTISRLPNANNVDTLLSGRYRQTKKVLTVEQLDTIAPIKCIGLNNCKKFCPISCSTCLESFDHKTLHRTLPCNHSFHPSCIEKWLLESSTNCPMCRRDISQQQLIANIHLF